MRKTLTKLLAEEPVAVVGAGCLLPGASDLNELESLFQKDISMVRPMNGHRWEDYFLQAGSKDEPCPDSSTTGWGGWIESQRLVMAHESLREKHKELNRLEIISLHALKVAIETPDIIQSNPEKRAILMGCMSTVDDCRLNHFWIDEAENLERECPPEHLQTLHDIKSSWTEAIVKSHAQKKGEIFPATILQRMAKEVGGAQELAIYDAACASSLAAIEGACLQLTLGKSDVVITGGVEANLSIESFISFSRLNALADAACLPFSDPATGLSQGEGGVVLVLRRARDAVKRNLPILGIIRGLGSASDGRSFGIFEPGQSGQQKALERAYSGLDKSKVVFVEAHGTGTRVGDQTERQSLGGFFDNMPLVGATKAVFGHTKGAAGAVGLLRCLLAVNKGELVSTGIEARATESNSLLGAFEMPLASDHLLGVSSFGFGGVNYHLAIGSAEIQEMTPTIPQVISNGSVMVCGYAQCPVGKEDSIRNSSTLSLPRHTINRMDFVQLLALITCDQLFTEMRPAWDLVDKGVVSVLSGSNIATRAARRLSNRLSYHSLEKTWPHENKEFIQNLKQNYPQPDEETCPSILSNIIAGRIANYFDFHGPSMNLSKEVVSPLTCIQSAALRVQGLGGITVVCSVDEIYRDERLDCQQMTLAIWVLADEHTVEQYSLPTLGQIQHT